MYATERTETKRYYNPILIEAYKEIARQNNQYHFVKGLVTKVGIPLWAESFIYFDKNSKENLVLIPLSRHDKNEVSGIISVSKQLNLPGKPYVINAMNRNEILNVETGDARQKKVYNEWMLRYDGLIFGKKDTLLKASYFKYRNKVADPLYGPTEPPCAWTLVNLCWDSNSNNVFVGSDPHDLTPDGDYDGDGIPNKNDDEWIEWIATYGDSDHDGVPNNKDPDWLCFFIESGDHDLDGIPNDQDQDWIDLENQSGGYIDWTDLLDDFWDEGFWDDEDHDDDEVAPKNRTQNSKFV